MKNVVMKGIIERVAGVLLFALVNGKIKKLGAHTSIVEEARNYDRIAYMKYNIKDKLNFPEQYDLK